MFQRPFQHLHKQVLAKAFHGFALGLRGVCPPIPGGIRLSRYKRSYSTCCSRSIASRSPALAASLSLLLKALLIGGNGFIVTPKRLWASICAGPVCRSGLLLISRLYRFRYQFSVALSQFSFNCFHHVR